LWSAVYGFRALNDPPSLRRTLIKVLAVASLIPVVGWTGAPPLLMAGLALSALGDAFLAGNPKRWLPWGLASFLIAQLIYVALFAFYAVTPPSPPRAIGIAAAGLAAAAMFAWLWPRLGALRLPVAGYVLAITAMVATALMLPPGRSPATVGAVLFFCSDAILAAQLFRERFTGRGGALAVWWLYYLGQVGIAWGFLRA